MTALPTKPGFGPRGLLDLQAPTPRGLLDISRADANIRRSAADAVLNPALPSLPALTPVREPPRPYRGAEMAAQGVGMAMDVNKVAAASAEAVARKIMNGKDTRNIVKKLDKGLRRAGGAAAMLAEGFGAADDIQRGVPKSVAIPGAVYRGGATLGAGAIAGGLLGIPMGPVGMAVGGLIGSYLADRYLPDREYLGRAVPKAMEEFGRHPYYDGGF